MRADRPAGVEVYHGDHRDCGRIALALQAADIEYEIENRGADCVIVAASEDAERARSEIEAFLEETQVRRPPTAAFDSGDSGWIGALGYFTFLAIITALQHNNMFATASQWLDSGRLNSGLVRQGQWWRAVTALTLHVDFAHLLANLVIGGLIGLFAGQALGSGLAWMTILLAGAGGNLLSASIRPAGHSAIGASTAVFGAVGILAALEWSRRRPTRGPVLLRFAPIIGGVILLSYLGTGGERTDVISHTTGFVCGMILGTLLGKLTGKRPRRAVQWLLGGLAVAAIVLAWVLALDQS